MKKTIALLVFALTFTGMTFASFHVEKSNKVNNSNTIVVENEVSEIATSISESSVAMATNPSDDTSKPAKNPTVAIILALVSVIFLPFGLHNWYLGRTKQALWQTLMVFPGFILLFLPLIASWIWQLVDLIMLLINGTL
jgi:TM2 domain-containing membrane protein YozV